MKAKRNSRHTPKTFVDYFKSWATPENVETYHSTGTVHLPQGEAVSAYLRWPQTINRLAREVAENQGFDLGGLLREVCGYLPRRNDPQRAEALVRIALAELADRAGL